MSTYLVIDRFESPSSSYWRIRVRNSQAEWKFVEGADIETVRSFAKKMKEGDNALRSDLWKFLDKDATGSDFAAAETFDVLFMRTDTLYLGERLVCDAMRQGIGDVLGADLLRVGEMLLEAL